MSAVPQVVSHGVRGGRYSGRMLEMFHPAVAAVLGENVFVAQPFTLSAPPGDHSQELNWAQSLSAASALVKCEPYTGDASAIVSTLRPQPGSGS